MRRCCQYNFSENEKHGNKFTNNMDNDKVMSVLAMKAHCEAKHSVVFESLNHNATMWECMLWCALRSVMSCASPIVCGMSFFEMSRTCPCFHDCGIHTCPSFQISTNPLTIRPHNWSLNSLGGCQCLVTSKAQCHLWGLMKRVFNSLMS